MTKKSSILWIVLLCCFTFVIGYNLSGNKTPETMSVAQSAETFHWKMVTTWPPNFQILQEGAEQLAKDIEMMSGGRFKVQVFAGGELVPPLQTFDAVSQGTVQMGHSTAFYWAGKVPAAQFMSGVPFGMTAKGIVVLQWWWP
jgi:TRAP-type mannitol/chloroaromatic compound transport system substrate-binding protein